MRTLIVSDIHGNLPALEALVARQETVDEWLCLGDNVNYAPWSNECVDLIAELPHCRVVKGNHEDFYLTGRYEGHTEIGQAFFRQCYPAFNRKEQIENYADSLQLGPFQCTHTLDDSYIFHDSPIEISCDSMIGHSHQQYLVERSGHRLLNPGSVGQDRKFINRANYAIYDSESDEIELKSFLFDIDIVLREMKALSYPQICMDYYQGKKRL